MNTMELNVTMLRQGKNASDLAKAIKKSHVSFNKRRCGDIPFNVDEINTLRGELGLDGEQVDVIFFDGTLLNGKLSAKTTS